MTFQYKILLNGAILQFLMMYTVSFYYYLSINEIRYFVNLSDFEKGCCLLKIDRL